MKEQFTVYIEPDLMRALTEYADRRGKPKSLVAEAAIASFLSPDAAECQEAALPGAWMDHPAIGTIGARCWDFCRDHRSVHPLLVDGDAFPA